MTPSSSRFKELLWAVDALGDLDAQRAVAESLRALFSGRHVVIQPVYVHPGPVLLVPRPQSLRKEATTWPELEQHLADWLARLNFPGALPPKFLFAEGPSVRDQVRALAEYARGMTTPLVALSGTTKTRAEKWFLGSFAEKLLKRTDLPLFLVRPGLTVPSRLQNLFFPTDFSARSETLFDEAVRLAGEAGARVTLFHQIKPILVPSPPYMAGPPYLAVPAPMPAADDRERVNAYRSIADRWKERALARGVAAECIVHEGAESTAELILSRLREMPQALVLMLSSAGAVSPFRGSVTREVVRRAPCPVIAIHERAFAVEAPHEAAA